MQKHSYSAIAFALPANALNMLRDGTFEFVTTSSPTSSVSWHGAFLDIHLMMSKDEPSQLLTHILGYLRLIGNTSMYDQITQIGGLLMSKKDDWITNGSLFSLKSLGKDYVASRNPQYSTGSTYTLLGTDKNYPVIWGPNGFLNNLKDG